MISLVIPSYGGGPNIERTIESAKWCDEIVIISTALFDEDKEHFRQLTPNVVELPWNYVFLHGFGSLHNAGSAAAKNDWLLLLGVSETVAEDYCDVHASLRAAKPDCVFRCDHVNDPHTWKRIWNRNGGTSWSGIIHEEITSGVEGKLLFRMHDTDKVPREDAVQREALRYIKALSYNWLYYQLIQNPARLGAANSGWLKFVRGSRETIESFITEHGPMMEACINGNLGAFISLVEHRMGVGEFAHGVNFLPQGAAV